MRKFTVHNRRGLLQKTPGVSATGARAVSE